MIIAGECESEDEKSGGWGNGDNKSSTRKKNEEGGEAVARGMLSLYLPSQ
jgi:hypothetical protein